MDKELSDHLKAVHKWIEEKRRDAPQPSPGLSSEERKQLEAVNNAVEQLKKSGVPIPEDLRRLKLKLSTRDTTASDNTKIESLRTEAEELIENLTIIVKAARKLKDSLKTNNQAGGPKKHYGANVRDLIQHGLISTGDKLQLQWLKDGPKFEGKINSDGTISVKEATGWKQYNSLSTAAKEASQRSLNGWEHWYRINRDGTTTSLKEIRTQFLIGNEH